MTSNLKIAEQVQKLARVSGAFILNEASRFNIEDARLKGRNDFVSNVDLESEKMLVDGLRKIVPEAGFITEEGTADNNQDKLTWVIDPLDGTTNFMHGLPPYSISIALTEREKILVGIVYVITTDEMFSSTRDGGTWLNGERVYVSGTSHISNMLVGTGFPFKNFELIMPYLNTLKYFMMNTHGVRRMGSAAVDLAYVSCGRFDSFFEYNLNPWDVSAGILLIREAGGMVSDFSGNENNITGKEIVASNRLLFKEFSKIVKENMKIV